MGGPAAGSQEQSDQAGTDSPPVPRVTVFDKDLIPQFPCTHTKALFPSILSTPLLDSPGRQRRPVSIEAPGPGGVR